MQAASRRKSSISERVQMATTEEERTPVSDTQCDRTLLYCTLLYRNVFCCTTFYCPMLLLEVREEEA